jgi:hypothetical protein
MAVGTRGAKWVGAVNSILSSVGLVIIALAFYVYYFDSGPVAQNFIQGNTVVAFNIYL